MEKWTPKWDLGHSLAISSISVAIFGHFKPGAIFHFLSHFPGIFVSGRFPILHMATSIARLECRFWGLECQFGDLSAVFYSKTSKKKEKSTFQGKGSPT